MCFWTPARRLRRLVQPENPFPSDGVAQAPALPTGMSGHAAVELHSVLTRLPRAATSSTALRLREVQLPALRFLVDGGYSSCCESSPPSDWPGERGDDGLVAAAARTRVAADHLRPACRVDLPNTRGRLRLLYTFAGCRNPTGPDATHTVNAAVAARTVTTSPAPDSGQACPVQPRLDQHPGLRADRQRQRYRLAPSVLAR